MSNNSYISFNKIRILQRETKQLFALLFINWFKRKLHPNDHDTDWFCPLIKKKLTKKMVIRWKSTIKRHRKRMNRNVSKSSMKCERKNETVGYAKWWYELSKHFPNFFVFFGWWTVKQTENCAHNSKTLWMIFHFILLNRHLFW